MIFLGCIATPLASLPNNTPMSPCRPPPRPTRRRASAPALPAAPARPGWTLGEAMRTPHFWLLFSVYMFTGLGSYFVSLHQLAFAIDIGFDRIYAAWVLGMGALLAVFGTIVTGTLSD